jgi:hypothetical protein
VNFTFGLLGKKAALAAALAENKACKGHAQCFGGSPQRALKADDSGAKKAKSSRTKMSDKARKKAKEMHEKKHGKKESPPIMEL